MPTASTLPLVLLIILLWKLTRGNVLAIVLFTSIFDAASALNFSSVGLAPWVATLLGCLFVKVIFGHRPVAFSKRINRTPILLFSIFFGYALMSSIVFPNLFEGMMVFRFTGVEPLSWGLTNLAQLCYLLAVGAVFLLSASRKPEEMQVAVQWFVRGCMVSTFFALYQLANATLHVPYPDAVLYSNPSHVIFPAYQMNGFWRLSSTFPEASELAGFMALGLGLLGWEMAHSKITAWSLTKFLLLLGCAVLTFSTTGYLTLAYILVIAVILYARHVFLRGTIEPRRLILGILTASSLMCCAASPRVRSVAGEAIRSTVLDKKDSDSYKARTETHGAALETARNTYLLGAGWGSVRPSGLFYMLVASVGAIGLLTFFGAVISLYLPLFRRNRPQSPFQLYEQSLFGSSIMLLAMLIAGAEPVTPVLWALFGIAVACGRNPRMATIHRLHLTINLTPRRYAIVPSKHASGGTDVSTRV